MKAHKTQFEIFQIIILTSINLKLQSICNIIKKKLISACSEEIKNQSDSCIPLSKQIVQMAEDFEFDRILKIADELEAS